MQAMKMPEFDLLSVSCSSYLIELECERKQKQKKTINACPDQDRLIVGEGKVTGR